MDGHTSGANYCLIIDEATDGKYVHSNNAEELQAVFAGVSEDITHYNKDSDGDMLNDYYEEKMADRTL